MGSAGGHSRCKLFEWECAWHVLGTAEGAYIASAVGELRWGVHTGDKGRKFGV